MPSTGLIAMPAENNICVLYNIKSMYTTNHFLNWMLVVEGFL